jgi:ATP-dependent RNA helicase RhlE
MSAFAELKITKQFIDALTTQGIEQPTEIQSKAIPMILAGQDVVGIAQTGTGKTLAYLLPIVQKLKFAQGTDPRVLILAPTKELVVQIERVLAQLIVNTDLRYVALYGGIGPKAQSEKLEQGVDVIIATPGRFLEIYSKRVFVTKAMKTVVLDECDRMMDMGFWPQLRDIQEKIPHKKQQLLFSATFPDKVQRIADNFLLFPNILEVTPQATPAETVEQYLYSVPNNPSKINLLVHLLETDASMSRVMVFCRTKEWVTQIHQILLEKKLGKTVVIHSNKGQNARINAMDEFKAGDVRVLVTTDVTARGIDVAEVSHVVNFQIPHQHEDYVHRIGRTGRAFKTGVAISMMDVAEVYHVRKIEQLMKQEIERKDIPEGVVLSETVKSEMIAQNRDIDWQKRKDNPDFKGAFHEKKIKWSSKDNKKDGKKGTLKPKKRF